jgi:Ca-activated chloride channel family protein
MNIRSILAGIVTLGLSLSILLPEPFLYAQDGPQPSSSETVAKPKRQQNPAPSDGSPTGPVQQDQKQQDQSPDQQKIPTEYKKQPAVDRDAEAPTFRADATTVTVPIAVLDQKGRFIPNIPQSYFRVEEDGTPQQIASFSKGEAPMTVCLLIEFSGLFQAYWSYGWGETLTAAYGFVDTLKPEDNIAVVAFDLRDTILSDFTTDRRKTQEALARLRIPGFSESNIFDALTDMADRMSNIDGRKAILVIASGRDTFSKITYDKARRSLQSSGVPIYSISILQVARELADARGSMGPIAQLDFLQADNAMRTFAKETGGQAFFPRFEGELPSVFRAVSDSLRNQYTIAYHPSNVARDGKYRKIKVSLVNPSNGEPLKVVENGKAVKYQIMAKAGYNAPRTVE